MTKKEAEKSLRERASEAEKAYRQFIAEYDGKENPYAIGSAVSWAKDAISLYKKLGDESHARKFGREVINTLNKYEEALQEAQISADKYFKEDEPHVSGRIKFAHALAGQHTKDAIGRFQSDKKRIEDLIEGRKDGIAGKVSVTVSIIGILGGIFFISSSITGNVIATLTNSTSNIIGAGLFALGIVAGIFTLKHR